MTGDACSDLSWALRTMGSSTHVAKSTGSTLLPQRIVVTRRVANRSAPRGRRRPRALRMPALIELSRTGITSSSTTRRSSNTSRIGQRPATPSAIVSMRSVSTTLRRCHDSAIAGAPRGCMPMTSCSASERTAKPRRSPSLRRRRPRARHRALGRRGRVRGRSWRRLSVAGHPSARPSGAHGSAGLSRRPDRSRSRRHVPDQAGAERRRGRSRGALESIRLRARKAVGDRRLRSL